MASEDAPQRPTLYIFISYGHDDKATPDQCIMPLPEWIKQGLESAGHKVWIDYGEIKPGDNWAKQIQDGLDNVVQHLPWGRILFLMTPRSVRNGGFCQDELLVAKDKGVPIVPVAVLPCETPIYIYSLQRHEMYGCVPCSEDKKNKYQELFGQLLRGLESVKPSFENLNARLLKDLQPIDTGNDLNFHLPNFTGRTWILEAIESWRTNASASPLFLLEGGPGTGKSAITAKLCLDRQNTVAALHVCSYRNKDKANPSICVRSIAHQLSTHFDSYAEALDRLDWDRLKDADAMQLFDEVIVAPLRGVPKPQQTYLVAIDALDEAKQDGENALVRLLSDQAVRLPAWLRVFATSRPEVDVTSKLGKFQVFEIEAESSANLADIRAYASEQLKKETDDPAVLANAVDTIVTSSQGVFLYAQLVCDDLRNKTLNILDPAALPVGLDAYYSSMFERIYGTDGKAFEDVQPKLGVIAVACGLLPKEAVYDIFGLNKATAKKFFDPLASVFPIVDGCYRPNHKSILDWLLAASDSTFFVDEQDAHRRLAKYCWDKCEKYVKGDLPLTAELSRSYPFRFGVRHLIKDRRFGDALNLLNYLYDQPTGVVEQDELNQMAKLLATALGDKESPVSEEEAKAIAPEKLAKRIQGLYMVEPLKGGMTLLATYYPDELEKLLAGFLATNDYVLRHSVAEALGSVYVETAKPGLLEKIERHLSSRDMNEQELGAYALLEVYVNRPQDIKADKLNVLADGEVYPLRSALGDMLIALSMEAKDPAKADQLKIMRRVGASSRFWNPIWKFNEMDTAALRAIEAFVAGNGRPEGSAEVLTAYDGLATVEQWRQELLRDSEVKDSPICETLKRYSELGVDTDLIPGKTEGIKNLSKMERVFEVLFAHPLWEVTETAASLLASIVDEDPDRVIVVGNLFSDKKFWRVQYGAAEAAFLARFGNRNKLFTTAIEAFYQHPEPLLRGDIAENLAAWILGSLPDKRAELMNRFEKTFQLWLTNEDEDAWVLDHTYWLFHQLHQQGHSATEIPWMDMQVSRILGGDRRWYEETDRLQFLKGIEQRRRERLETKAASA